MRRFSVAPWPDSGTGTILLFPCVPAPIYELLRKRSLAPDSSSIVKWHVEHGDLVNSGDVIAEFMVEPVKSTYVSQRPRFLGLLGRGVEYIRPQLVAWCGGLISLGVEEFTSWPDGTTPLISGPKFDAFYSEHRNIFFGLERPLRDKNYVSVASLFNVYRDVVRYCYSVIEGDPSYSRAEEEAFAPKIELLANSLNAVVPIESLRDG